MKATLNGKFKHMKKYTYLLLVCVVLFYGCQRNEVIRTHGIAYLDKREKLIIINSSNKNDTIKVLGQPATRGLSGDNLWIYIERTKTRGKLLKLGRNYLKKNNVLVLEFNKFGILTSKKFYDKENMQDINFSKAETENELRKENFVYGFLSSIRQKMNARKK